MVFTNGENVWKASGCDAIYTACEYLMRYISGFVAENGCVVTDCTGTTLYTDKRYLEAAEKLYAGSDVKVTLYSQKELLARLAAYETVGISFDQTSHSEFVALENAGVKMVNIDREIEKLTAIKKDYELENIRRACEIAEEAFLRLLPKIEEGMTETEVAALLEYYMRSLGASGLSFETIVAFGAHAAVPHHETGDTKLCFGDVVLIDFGCRVNGYCSDITRTFLFGDDGKHEEFKKAYQAVLSAHLSVLENAKSGMMAKDCDGIARKQLKAAGYGEKFTHSLGHGIGLNVHEFPYVNPKSETILQDGMVFSDEPGVYVEGEYGIRIEDTVYLSGGKLHSFMSKTDKNLLIL